MAAPETVTCQFSRSLRVLPGLIHDRAEHRPPLQIQAELRQIEQEILQGIEELEGMLGLGILIW